MVARRVRRARARAAAAPVHDRHRRRRLGDEPALRPDARHRAGRRPSARSSSASARTARSARTRTRSRSSAPTRRSRAGLLRLRLEEVGLADRVAPALRPEADPGALPGRAGELRRLPPVRAARARPRCSAAPRPARRCCSTARTPPDEVWDAALPAGPGADPRQAHRAVRDRRRPDRPRGGPAGTHQHDPADVLLRDSPGSCRARRRSPGSRRRSRRPTAGAAPRSSSATTPRSTARSTGCTSRRSRSPRRRARDAPLVPARCARVRSHGHRGDAGRPRRRAAGQRAAGRRHLPERHRRLREAQHLRARRGLGSGPLHPVRQLQLRLPAQRDPLPPTTTSRSWTERPTGSGRRRSTPSGCPTPATPCRSTSRTAPAARCASRPARSSRPETRAARRSTSRRASRSSPAERENIAFFETLPATDRSRVDFGTVRGTQFLEPLFEFSGRLRGLRRDAVRQAALAALRRPADGRERHRLLVDLRRQPADHAVDDRRRRPRPRLVELALRGQRRVRARLPARRRPARRARAPAPRRAARRARRGAGRRDPRRAAAAGVGAARPARAGRRAEAPARRGSTGRCRRPAERRRPPGPAQRVDRRRRRLGLRHRLRRARPRPGQRAQRERARARHRGLLEHRRPDVEGDPARRRRQVRRRRQDRAEEGPRAAGDRLRQRLRRPRRDGRRPPADAERVPRGRGLRRPVARDRLQPLHRARHRDEQRARPAVPRRRERLLAADPLRPGGARRRAATRSCSTRRGRGSRSATTPTASCATARSRTPTRPRPSGCTRWPSRRSRSAGTCTRRWRPAAPSTSPPTRARSADGPRDRLHGPRRCATRSSRRRRRSPRPSTACGGSPTPASARSSSTRSSRSSCAVEALENARLVDAGTESFAESLSYFPAAADDEPARAAT